MNDYMLKLHSPKDVCKDFVFSRGITTAVYTEGVIKAYDLAKALKDEQRAECYRNFIKEALDHILSLQVIENEKKEAIGGFLSSKVSQTMRVDNNQHAVMALIDAYNSGIIDNSCVNLK